MSTEADSEKRSAVTLSVSELLDSVGTKLPRSSTRVIAQRTINEYAAVIDDYQWIHVDPSRAINGPFGKTVAHGYLTLSFVPVLLTEVFQVRDARMIVNYGLNRLRFPSPVLVDSEIYLEGEIISAENVKSDWTQVVLGLTIQATSETRPACVLETILRYK